MTPAFIPAQLHQEPHPLDNRDGLWTPQGLAKELSVAVATLSDWRVRRIGPDFIKIGGLVRYKRSDVERWLDGCAQKGA
jgi:hypothetical protein